MKILLLALMVSFVALCAGQYLNVSFRHATDPACMGLMCQLAEGR